MIDAGHKAVDELLRRTEREIVQIYDRAAKEAQAKTDEYFRRFAERDKKKLALKDAGKISEQEYLEWRKNQMLTGQRWADLTNVLTEDLTNADKIAMSVVNGHTPEAYAVNMNYGTYQIESELGIDTGFTLYDRPTVERLVRDKPDLLPAPKVDIPEDKRWNMRHVRGELTQSVLQGEPISKLATRLQKVTDMDRRSAMRNARTAMTGAQNAGRVDAYQRAKDMGIAVKQEWLSAHDGHTRESHLDVDGEQVEVGHKFSNDCAYPGDPGGPPAEVYNCRCTLIPVLEGFEGRTGRDYEIAEYEADPDVHGMSFEEWKERRGDKQPKIAEQPKPKAVEQPKPEKVVEQKPKDNHNIVEGHNMAREWKRREGDFKFEIEDIINAQGFDGVPRVVSPSEFDAYVSAANGGQGFIAQRTYSAPSQEVLDAYRQQLYSGQWYVDCSAGGSQYGKGMYASSNYSGELTQQIQDDMKHYQAVNQMPSSYVETFTLDPSAKVITYSDIMQEVVGNEDPGFVAALLGYDAINVEERGYTVVLNRTKLIIREGG